MTKRELRAFAISFFVTLATFSVVWALTKDDIWNAIYDSANTALRINIVAGS